MVQDGGDVAVAGAVPAAATAVGEHHDPGRLVGHGQLTGQAGRPGADFNLFRPRGQVTGGRCAGLCRGAGFGGALQAGEHAARPWSRHQVTVAESAWSIGVGRAPKVGLEGCGVHGERPGELVGDLAEAVWARRSPHTTPGERG